MDAQLSRKVTRSDGKISKESILEATLILILDQGLRGIKYKTVSEVAGVTPSSIAYYFNSIEALIEESFKFYFSKYAEAMIDTRLIGERVLQQYKNQDLTVNGVKHDLIDSYVESVLDIVAHQSPEVSTFLLLDRIFRNETLTNPSLYRILKVQDQYDIDAITDFLSQLGCENPEIESVQFMSLLWYLSEKLLQEKYSTDMRNRATELLSHFLKKRLLC